MGTRLRSVSPDNVSPDDFNLICRACLQKCELEALLSFTIDEHLRNFIRCTSIMPTQKDFLPWQICSDCLSKCDQLNQFRTMCLDNERVLQSFKSFESFIEYVEEDQQELQTRINEVVVEHMEEKNDNNVEVQNENTVEEETEEYAEEEDIIDVGYDQVIEVVPEEYAKDEVQDIPVVEEEEEEEDDVYEVFEMETDNSINMEVRCPFCPKTEIWSAEFDRHLMEHVNAFNEPGQFACPRCGRDFETAIALLWHIHEEYSKLPVELRQVQIVFGNSEKAKPTITQRTRQVGGRISKTRIPNVAKPLSSPKANAKKNDNGNICDLCGKTLKDSINLERHRMRHSNNRPHKCHLCEQSFVFAAELASHIQYHDPANHKFVCLLCVPERRYFFKRSLKAHMMRNHKKRERDQVCPVCEKRFYDLPALKKHAVIHTGQKPFECSLCHQRFVRGDHLKTHMKTHEGRPKKSSNQESGIVKSNK